jgi:hypothetical protein
MHPASGSSPRSLLFWLRWGPPPASGFRLQAINLFGGIGLCQIGCDMLMGFARKSFQIGLLGSGHLLVAGNPIIGALYAVRVFARGRS